MNLILKHEWCCGANGGGGEFEIDGKSDGAVLVDGTFVGISEGLIEDCSEGLIEGCVESEGVIDGDIDGWVEIEG